MTTIIEKTQEIANAIDHVMADELKLQAPMKYQLVRDGRFILVIAVMDEHNLRGSINRYTNEALLHQLSTAVSGLPVVLSNHSGVRYAVSMTGKPQLKKMVAFPAGKNDLDVMRFGVSLRGEVHLHWSQIMNLLIGGSQSSGKSMILKTVAHSARMDGAKLYLVDPVSHTFNPDVWDAIAAVPVAGTKGDVLSLLKQAEAEIEARVALFRKMSVGNIPPENVDEYNAMAVVKGMEMLPRVHVIGDEMNTYLEDRAVREAVSELARQGRKWGVHLTMAAHNWRAEDISRGLSALFPARLCLRVADSTSGNVTLSSTKWGKQVLNFKNPGRAVLFANGRYQKVQLYYVSPDQERAWLGDLSAPVSPLSASESELVMRSMREAGGKMTRELLMGWGMGQSEARKMVEAYELRGWLAKDPARGNARFVTQILADLVTNRPTQPTLPTALQVTPTWLPTQPTAGFAGA